MNAFLELKIESTLLSESIEEKISAIQKGAISLINNYKLSGQTLESGAPFFGPETSSKALLKAQNLQDEFKEACKKAQIEAQEYLKS